MNDRATRSPAGLLPHEAAPNGRAARSRAALASATRGACAGLLGVGLAILVVCGTATANDTLLEGASVIAMQAPSMQAPRSAPARLSDAVPGRADFAQQRASGEARHIADWVVDSGDSQGMPFVIVDKAEATVFVFGPTGKLRGSAPALLGLARGDESVPGIGDRKLSTIRPEERTTPAGRFVSSIDRNLGGKEILWVDYDSAVSMHRVITSNAKERRLERLNSPSTLDNRISYGCINVPVSFFDNVLLPAFHGTNGIVYVLPETKAARTVFASYDVGAGSQAQVAHGSTLTPTAMKVAKK